MSPKTKTVSFVDFYRTNNISPVSQDISDLGRHYGRRESLYRLLGIAPRFVRGLDVLELCPGSGHNSIYTQSLSPASYTLVDGNPIGLSEAKALFANHYPASTEVTFVLSLIADYQTDRVFDLVLCEGAIPFQNDPHAFTQDLVRFVADKGVLVITCADSVSVMGECIRRLLASKLFVASDSISERVERLRPAFAPHLASLKSASRPIDDWVLDNIVQPFTGKTFSTAQAIALLDAEGFEIFGSSPSFQSEWRWYKDLVPGKTKWNAQRLDTYFSNVLNFLDYRFQRPAHDNAFGMELLERCQVFYTQLQSFEQGEIEQFDAAVTSLEELKTFVSKAAPETAEALEEVCNVLRDRGDIYHMPQFQTFFGRGQQYLSFIKYA